VSPGWRAEDYSEAIRLKPDHADAYYNRGIARRNKSDVDGANNDFGKARLLKKAL
jgi:Flp pilus assembly protein TadD